MVSQREFASSLIGAGSALLALYGVDQGHWANVVYCFGLPLVAVGAVCKIKVNVEGK